MASQTNYKYFILGINFAQKVWIDKLLNVVKIMSILDFNNMIDGTGKLVSLESKKNIPFEIKRVFYIFGTNEQSKRGSHAHYNTKQYLISIQGVY